MSLPRPDTAQPALALKVDKSQEEIAEAKQLHDVRYISIRYVLILFSISFILMIIVPILLKTDSLYFPVVGGIMGFGCAAYVMISCLRSKDANTPHMVLLFWRCVADLGISIRFMATPGFNRLICGDWYCNLLDGYSNSSCSFSSAMLEFFQISSEAWFICVGVDLYLSITRPFSSFKSRLKYYHLFSWGLGVAFSIPIGMIPTLGGFWFISDRNQPGEVRPITTETICWIQINAGEGQTLSWKPWVMFYIPLIFCFCVSTAVLYNAFKRLKTGATFTFIHRLKVLFMNSVNISTCLVYWIVVLIIYISTYVVANSKPGDQSTINSSFEVSHQLFLIILFLLPAKGTADLMVWTLSTSTVFESDGVESLDLNSALREEVLMYASEGIRHTSKLWSHLQATSQVEKNRRKVKIILKTHANESHATAEQGDIISGRSFIKLMLGFQEPLERLREALTNRVKARQEILTTFRNSILRNSLGGPPNMSELQIKAPTMGAISEANKTDSMSSREDRESADAVERPVGEVFANMNPLQMIDMPLNSAEDGKAINAQRDKSESSFHTAKDRLSSKPTPAHPANPTLPPKMNSARFPTFYVGDECDNFDVVVDPEVFKPEAKKPWYTVVLESILKLPKTLFCWCTATDSLFAEFSEFAPHAFGRVRESVNLSESVYRDLFLERVKERLTQGGASGAFFFFSKDEFLIAKSCTEEEAEVLVNNAEKYADYMTSHRDSYISKVYGCYMLSIYDTRLFFMVMNNIFLNDRQHYNLVKYDIKGSWIARNASLPRTGDKVTCKFCEQKYIVEKKSNNRKKSKRSRPGDAESQDFSGIGGAVSAGCTATVDRMHEASVIYKDNDLREKILLPPDAAAKLLDQLKADAAYLHSVGVMDYSLLMGVHYTKYAVNASERPEAEDEERMLRPSSHRLDIDHIPTPMKSLQYCVPLEVGRVVGPDCYYLGIIDFQQTWTWNKVFERWLKIIGRGTDPNGLSAIDPDTYYHRFCEKMEDLFHRDYEDAPTAESPDGRAFRTATVTAVNTPRSKTVTTPRSASILSRPASESSQSGKNTLQSAASVSAPSGKEVASSANGEFQDVL